MNLGVENADLTVFKNFRYVVLNMRYIHKELREAEKGEVIFIWVRSAKRNVSWKKIIIYSIILKTLQRSLTWKILQLTDLLRN